MNAREAALCLIAMAIAASVSSIEVAAFCLFVAAAVMLMGRLAR